MHVAEGEGRHAAPGAIHRIMVPAAGPLLEKCAPLFRELLRHAQSRDLLLQLSNLLFELAASHLTLRDFIFTNAKPILKKRDVFARDERSGQRGKPAPGRVEGGQDRVHQGRESSTWCSSGPRGAPLRMLGAGLLALGFLVPWFIGLVMRWIAWSFARMVVGR